VNSNGLSARKGYDRAAVAYASWHWTEFWQRNEAPLVRRWLQSRKGLGLDAGAGTGIYCVADAVRRGVGVDISAGMLRKHLQASPARQLLLAQADVQSLPFRSHVFDWVLCTRVLSHVHSPRTALAEFARVARPGAEILISDVHPAHPYDSVSIPIPEGDVVIETIKHSIETITSDVQSVSRLRILTIREFRLSDLLWMPPRPRFEKVFRDPSLPIFYILHLVVTAR
jgi:ubiquinone/menaquinone biosynthesis C-methylase UbiE